MNKKGFTTPVLILAIIFLLGLGIFVFVQMNNSDEVIPKKESLNRNENQKNTNNTGSPDLVEMENGLVANLKDVSGGKSTGTASILRENNFIIHNVDADLPVPEGSDFYEGWLVDQGTGQFFSTGIMDNTADGRYSLSYSENDISEGYNFVVITRETVKDEKPETHILEGLAE